MKSRILPENVFVELCLKTFASPLYKHVANFEFANLGCLLTGERKQWQWVSSRSVGGAIQLVRCPPNLRVAFNKIISEVQGGEAPPMDLELTHFRQRLPRIAMKKIIFSKRPSLVEVTLQFEDGVDRNTGQTYELVDASTCHR